MTRVLSGAVLLAITIAVVWFASATIFFLVAEAFLLISFGEYAALARASGTPVPELPSALAAGLTAMAFSRVAFNVPWISMDIVLMASLVVLGGFTLAQWKSGPNALALASASVFPCFYLGLPIGAMIVIREVEGPQALFLLNHPLLQAPNSGWVIDHILEEEYWRVGPYLPVDVTMEELAPGVVLPFVHRPLSQYVNAMAEHGLLIERMEEPAPPEGFLAKADEYRAAATIPRLLLLLARKTPEPA